MLLISSCSYACLETALTFIGGGIGSPEARASHCETPVSSSGLIGLMFTTTTVWTTTHFQTHSNTHSRVCSNQWLILHATYIRSVVIRKKTQLRFCFIQASAHDVTCIDASFSINGYICSQGPRRIACRAALPVGRDPHAVMVKDFLYTWACERAWECACECMCACAYVRGSRACVCVCTQAWALATT